MSEMSFDESLTESKSSIGTTAPLIQPIQEGAKSSVDTVELPTGYLDDEGKLHKEVRLKEMTGEEEDILTSRKMPLHARLNRILENCIESIGDYDQGNLRWKSIIKDLISTDRLFLILQIRILSLGPIFSAKLQCEECEAYSNQSVDLNDFKISGIKDPFKRTWDGKLPKSGFTYIAKCQNGWDDIKLANVSNSGKDMMTLAILGRLIELNGKNKITLQDLKKLGLADRQYLRKDFNKHEGELDKSIEFECPECGHENKEDIDIGTPFFFFPSETPES